MLGFLAGILSHIGAFVASTCEIGCMVLFLVDEPECPSSLIK